MAVAGTSPAVGMGQSIAQAKAGFFDSEIVIRAMDAGKRRALAKAGAFVRTTARSMIRKAPGVNTQTGQVARGRRKKGVRYVEATAKPGDPPYGHASQLLKKFIYFSWDTESQSEVIGPALLQSPRGGGPKFIEYGGGTSIRTKKGKMRRAQFHGNPVMHPALEKGLGELLKSFENCM